MMLLTILSRLHPSIDASHTYIARGTGLKTHRAIRSIETQTVGIGFDNQALKRTTEYRAMSEIALQVVDIGIEMKLVLQTVGALQVLALYYIRNRSQ
jgi:hypothetical protein